MSGGVDDVALGALVDEELRGNQQCSSENERKHRGRELTGIIHRTSFFKFCSHGERRRSVASSRKVQIICLFFPNAGCRPASVIDLHPQTARIDLIPADALRAVTRRDRAGAGIYEIVAGDTGAVALRQPFWQARKAMLRQ